MEVNKIYLGDSAEVLKSFDSESIDMVLTSPPYDNMRTYNKYQQFDFETIANELHRVLKKGGVIVWIVDNSFIDGSCTMTSFNQAIRFNEIGFNINDIMIWKKPSFNTVGGINVRYPKVHEYMIILSKGKPKTFNPLKDRKNIHYGTKMHGTRRQKNGDLIDIGVKGEIGEYGIRTSVWEISNITHKSQHIGHPAIFPIQLAIDHILTWSNAGDIILDIFNGSGTTSVASIQTRRKYIGIEIDEEYYEKSLERIKKENSKITIYDFIGLEMGE